MAIAAREGAAKGAAETPTLRFDILAPGLPSRTLELKQDIVKIGKLSSSHIQIQDPAVSRVHAVIEVSPQGEVFVIDLGSSNGTFVNGQKISKERIKTGDEIKLGQTRLLVTVGSEEGALERTGPVPAAPDAPPPPAAGAAPSPAAGPPPDIFAAAAAPAMPRATSEPWAEPTAVTATPVREQPVRRVEPAPEPVVPVPPPAVPPSPPPAIAAAPAVPLPVAAAPAPAPVPVPEPPRRAVAPPPPEPTGRDRRFVAIMPAEPLSGAVANIVEARLAFGRDIIEGRTFESRSPSFLEKLGRRRPEYRRTSAVTIGPARDCDFVVEGYSDETFTLLSATNEGFVLRFRKNDLGRARLGDKDLDLSDLAKTSEATPADDDPDVYEWPFRQGALVSMKAGGTTLYLRSVPKAPPPPVRYVESLDPKLIIAFLGVVLFSGALVWRAVTWPPMPAVLLEDKLKLDDKMVSFLMNPEERERRAKIYGAKTGREDKEEGGALKGKEGQSGTRDAPKRRARLAIKGTQKEYTPAQRREQDLKKVRGLGALAALERDPTLKELMGGGGGGGPSSPWGIGVGGGPDADTAWGGVGGGPPGAAYGLEGFGLGGEGGGGGGIGKYVGVGRLATRGIGGGRGGTRFGAGEARFREHKTVEPKVTPGEPEVGGGLDRAIIRRVIRSHLHEIRYCYERELVKDTSLYGKVVVKFTILPSGSVHQAGVKSSTMGNENVEGCILRKVASWVFPKPYKGTPVIVSYPFLFKAAGQE